MRLVKPAVAEKGDELLSFPFEGANWDQKWTLLVLVLTVLSFLVPPLASILSMGLGSQIARPVILEGRHPALPARLDWSLRTWLPILGAGARWWLVSSLFQLPALVLMVGAAAWLARRYGIPRVGEAWAGLPEAWPVILWALAAGLPLALVSAWLSNAAQMHVTARGSLWAALRVGEWARVLLANWRGFFGALWRMLVLAFGVGVGQFALSLPASLLIIAPAFLAVFSGLYLRCISAALYARAYREGVRRLSLTGKNW